MAGIFLTLSESLERVGLDGRYIWAVRAQDEQILPRISGGDDKKRLALGLPTVHLRQNTAASHGRLAGKPGMLCG